MLTFDPLNNKWAEIGPLKSPSWRLLEDIPLGLCHRDARQLWSKSSEISDEWLSGDGFFTICASSHKLLIPLHMRCDDTRSASIAAGVVAVG